MMKRLVSFAAPWLFGGMAALALAASAPEPPVHGCEPGTTVGLRARVVDIVEQGNSARVTVEVTLDSVIDLRTASIRGRGISRLLDLSPERLAGRSRDRLVKYRQTERLVPANVVRYPVDLEAGKIHQLTFEAEIETEAGEFMTTKAHVTVNLDPDEKPHRQPGIVQYRARSLP